MPRALPRFLWNYLHSPPDIRMQAWPAPCSWRWRRRSCGATNPPAAPRQSGSPTPLPYAPRHLPRPPGLVITLFLALAAVQFVISAAQPVSSYILPTQQLVVATYALLGIIAAVSILVRRRVCSSRARVCAQLRIRSSRHRVPHGPPAPLLRCNSHTHCPSISPHVPAYRSTTSKCGSS